MSIRINTEHFYITYNFIVILPISIYVLAPFSIVNFLSGDGMHIKPYIVQRVIHRAINMHVYLDIEKGQLLKLNIF